MNRINVGCGRSPTNGWKNYDNSPTVRLARFGPLPKLFATLRILTKEQTAFLEFCQANEISWANAVARIPEPDHSLDVVYSSHMVEHLDGIQARQFLAEASRVLKPGGILRLAVPDLRSHVDSYLESGDADALVRATGLSRSSPSGLAGRLRALLIGDRGHKWMYDGPSLCKLLTQAGFNDPRILPPGETTIAAPGELDLRERYPESVFVEATRPAFHA